MTPTTIKWVANLQGVTAGCIYNRIKTGWSTNEIMQGKRDDGRKYTKPIDSRYNYANGQTAFMVILFDAVQAITKFKNEWEVYLSTVKVFYGLLERKESEDGNAQI